MIEAGTRLDRYECLHPIGKGGMANVWAARLVGKHGFEKLVAIKTVRPEHAGDPEFLKMLLDEAHILSGIRHPNVASVLDLGEQDGIFYLVFEWVEGEQLSKLRKAMKQKRVPIPLGLALRFMAQACAGLHAAHELCDAQGWPLYIVHRDVSPQNIMLTVSGDVKVIDFGIAKAMDRVAGDTFSGKIKGKTAFMAPEQVRGDPIDRRIDVWAAGVVLYQLIANRLPYRGETFDLLQKLASFEEAQPLPSTIPMSVVQVVKKALRPHVEERYQTAAEMQADLENAIVDVAGVVSAAEAAQVVETYLGDRLAEKREAIADALEQAAARSKAGGKHQAARAALKSLDVSASWDDPVDGDASESSSGSVADGSFSSLRPSSSRTGGAGGTVASSPADEAAAAPRRSRKTWALIPASVAAVALVVVLFAVAGKSDDKLLAPAQHVPIGAPTVLVETLAERMAASSASAAAAAVPKAVVPTGSASAAASAAPDSTKKTGSRKSPKSSSKRKDPLSVFGTR